MLTTLAFHNARHPALLILALAALIPAVRTGAAVIIAATKGNADLRINTNQGRAHDEPP